VKKHFPVVAINLVAVAVALFAFDVWRRAQPLPGTSFRMEGTVANFWYQHVDDMGYLPLPDRRETARKFVGDQQIYDVSYTIGPDSFRIAQRPAGARACVLNFGDSNTFGEGVNDRDSYVWQITDVSGGTIAAHNFGVSGYGPHHILGGLESGRVGRSIACTPTHATILFIPEHIGRAAGRAPWDDRGPRYILQDGKAVREGNFNTPGLPKRPLPDLDEGILGWRRLLGIDALGSVEDAELSAAILIEAARRLQSQYPGIRVHVLFWKIFSSRRMDEVEVRLKAAGLVLHRPDDMMPGYVDNWQKWVLSPLDRHPNPEAHRRIASYIAHEIVGQKR
jgi:hypothetical protein